MKNQTKAILASVMILALALSSIGGATYSWFSDEETLDLGISIATINIDTSLKTNVENETIREQTIFKVTTTGTVNITIPVKNNSPFPVDVSAKIVQTKEIARGYELIRDEETGQWTDTENAIEAVTVGFDKDESGNKDYSVATEELWWSSWNLLTFKDDDDSMVNMEAGTSSFIDVDVAKILYRTGTEKTVKMNVQSQDFYFNLGNLHLEPIDSDQFYCTMNIGQGFDWDVIDDLRVVLDITQCSLHEYDLDNSGHIDINITEDNRLEPILIMGQEITVKVSEDTIQDLSKISINYEKNGNSRTVTIVYYRNETPVTSGIVGDVRITYTAGDIHGSIIAPASGGTYTFTLGNNSP